MIMHLAISPNVKNHSIYLFTECISTLFLDHLDKLVLKTNICGLVVEDPSEKSDLEFFNKSLFVGQKLE